MIAAKSAQPDYVWYVSYGSNMYADRLTCYLKGGTPPGARDACPGCRDASPPLADTGHELPGGIYFATESKLWGGGIAFYDPALPGTAPARAYLLTAEQFTDIAAQEMHRAPEPGSVLDLRPVLKSGRDPLGPGRYETLLHLGDLDGYPLLTFTAAWASGDVDHTIPSAPYLRMLAGGLGEAHKWDVHRAARYLAGLPGANGSWQAADIAALC
ncbi:histone deacetylase [Amycolatopsis palatopharyngis]|uniref:histone deacetylase n=1 Tax=Amycolatopsis palatopharyngis TaxID=187982 RepID=UPI000E22AB7F|nr:histone deacetylase [Amycolatopsis palatopharyngis]